MDSCLASKNGEVHILGYGVPAYQNLWYPRHTVVPNTFQLDVGVSRLLSRGWMPTRLVYGHQTPVYTATESG